MTTGYKIELSVREPLVAPIGEALDCFADAIAAFEIIPGGDWRIEAYCTLEPDADAVAEALRGVEHALDLRLPPHDIAPLPPVDWLTENFRSFPAQDLGRFWIHGSHITARPPAGAIPLLIDAATAFGSGEHETTRGCLHFIERLAKSRRIRRPLDVGCGSAILALGIAKLAKVKVMACDIDPNSVLVARENAKLNHEHHRVRVVVANGYAHREIAKGRRYDLIVANILANPLCRLARDLARRLAPDGVAILSGLLDHQRAQVLAAHRRHGLVLARGVTRKGWVAMALVRRGRRRR